MKPLMEIQPPDELSRKIRGAISSALHEEKVPVSLRVAKSLALATLLALALLLPVKLLFKESLDSAWLYSGVVWWLFTFVGFLLYYTPHPRLTLPGYFSPSTFAKVMVVTSVTNIFQTLICPDLAFLDSPIGWSPFGHITAWLMDFGGMQACMFFCGFVFSALSSIAGFATVFRTLRMGKTKDYLAIAGLAALSQLPLFLAQLQQEGLRDFVILWLIGVLLGTVAGLTLWRIYGKVTRST